MRACHHLILTWCGTAHVTVSESETGAVTITLGGGCKGKIIYVLGEREELVIIHPPAALVVRDGDTINDFLDLINELLNERAVVASECFEGEEEEE